MNLRGFQIQHVQWSCMVLHGPAWSCMVYVFLCLSIWTQLAFPLADGLFTLERHKNGAQGGWKRSMAKHGIHAECLQMLGLLGAKHHPSSVKPCGIESNWEAGSKHAVLQNQDGTSLIFHPLLPSFPVLTRHAIHAIIHAIPEYMQLYVLLLCRQTQLCKKQSLASLERVCARLGIDKPPSRIPGS